MKLTRLFLFIAAAVTPAAHAQIAEIYGTANFTHISNIQTGAVSTSSGYVNQYTSNTLVGVSGGATLNFLNLPVVKLGFDVRGSTRPGTVGADTALGGIKLTIKPPVLKIKPFIEGAAGYLATRTNNVSTPANSGSPSYQTFDNQYAIYQIIGGIDYPLFHFVDFRVVEIGVGRSFGNINLINSSTNVTLFTVNTGLVVHF